MELIFLIFWAILFLVILTLICVADLKKEGMLNYGKREYEEGKAKFDEFLLTLEEKRKESFIKAFLEFWVELCALIAAMHLLIMVPFTYAFFLSLIMIPLLMAGLSSALGSTIMVFVFGAIIFSAIFVLNYQTREEENEIS